MITLEVSTPRWAKPLLETSRYKAAYGGRAGGKSHFFAELLVERMVTDPALFAVCIREIQKSIKDSVKRLLEGKIAALGVEEFFTSTQTEIRRNGGTGGVAFTGIRNHTADRFKGFEGAAIAWIDEGEAISGYSLDLILPTIRAPGSELWFSWNPRYADDPVDRLFRGPTPPPSSVVVETSSWDNPWLSEEARLAREFAQGSMPPDKFRWIYGGEYRSLGDDLVLAHKILVESFVPGPDWDGPYYGADWGYSSDPTAAVAVWRHAGRLWIEWESYAHRLELNDVASRWRGDIPGIDRGVVFADRSRPESIAHVRRMGIPGLRPADNWPGALEDGIEHMLSYQAIVVHPRCDRWRYEAVRWAYRMTDGGTPTGQLVPGHDHLMDATRYAIAPLIKGGVAPIAGRGTGTRRVGVDAYRRGVQLGKRSFI